MSIIIRKAFENDSVLLCSLIRQSFKDVAEKFELTVENCPTHASFISTERLRGDINNGVEFFIIEQDCIPVGCVGLDFKNSKLCYLIRIAILPEYRKTGLGKKLALHCIAYAGTRGISRIEIGIIAKEKELQNWYEKLGFAFIRDAQFNHLPFQVAFLVYHVQK